MLRAAVLGHPVAHSLSPLIHSFWLERLGIAGSYDKIDVAPEDLAAVLDRLRADGHQGVNLTIPLKETAFALLDSRPGQDELTPAARAARAVNTLVFRPDGARLGHNTDIFGFLGWLSLALAPAGTDGFAGAAGQDWLAALAGWRERLRPGPTVILGAGGAARGVAYALLADGFANVRVMNRTPERARRLAASLGGGLAAVSAAEPLPPGAALLVNATSAGLDGRPGPAVDLSPMSADGVVYDLVYKPLETDLLRRAKQRGLTAVDGLGMLIWQAAPAFECFFGRHPFPHGLAGGELHNRCGKQLAMRD